MKVEKENAFREIRKLIDILEKWGNVLVPSLPDKKETYAQERLQYFVNDLINNKGMTLIQIQDEIDNL